MDAKEFQESLITDLENWMKVEDSSVASTGAIIEKTDNPVIRLVMEIIQRDSLMHHRVQEFICNSFEKESVSISEDDLVDLWVMLERHHEIEKKSVESAKAALEEIKGDNYVVQKYLLNYLLLDEKKHDTLLEGLELIKKGINPYG